MDNSNLEEIKYPIGHFVFFKNMSDNQVLEWIKVLENFPSKLSALTQKLTKEQLDTPYRPEGWTVRQLIHHIADSHHHSYTRFKWALTEDKPVIKAYEEKDWANEFDARTAPIEISLNYITALHCKIVYMLKGLTKLDLDKCYVHPENNKTVSVKENIGKYAWHSNHHYAHIENLCNRMGWL